MDMFFVKDGKWSSLSKFPEVEEKVTGDKWNDWADRVRKSENTVVSTTNGYTLFKDYEIFVTVFCDEENSLYYIEYSWFFDCVQDIYTDNIHDAMELYFKLSKDVYSRLKLAYTENPCDIDVAKKDDMETTEHN